MADDGKIVIGFDADISSYNKKIAEASKDTEEAVERTAKVVEETSDDIGDAADTAKKKIKEANEPLGDTQDELDKVKKKTKEAESQVKASVDAVKDVGKIAANSINTAFHAAAAGIVALGFASVNLASDLTEVQNVVDTAFGKNAYMIEDFAKTAVYQFGLSELSAKQMASTFLAMGNGMEQGLDIGSEKAIEITGRLGDIASFYNKTAEEISTIGSAIYTGETEPLKAIGIIMTEANLQTYALAAGYETLYEDMSAADKLLVRQEYFLKQSEQAAGDFAKTLDSSLANQLRVAKEEVSGMAVELGEKLLPYALDAVKAFRANKEELVQYGKIAVGVLTTLKGYLVLGQITSAYVKMKAALGGVTIAQGLFNAAVLANPLGVALVATTALAAAAYAYSKEVTKASDNVLEAVEANKEYCDSIDEQTEAIDQAHEARLEGMESDLAEIESIDRLRRELDSLTDANGEVDESNRIRANYILGELNTALGTEYEMVDGLIDNYDDLDTAIKTLIETKRAETMLSAAEDAWTAGIQGQAAAYDEVGTAALKLAETQEQLEEKRAERDAAVAEVREKAVENYKESWAGKRALDAGTFNADEYLDTWEKTREGLSALAGATNLNWQDIQSLSENEAEYTQALADAQSNLDTLLADIAIYEDASALFAAGDTQGAIDALEKYSSTLIEAKDIANETAEEQTRIAKEQLDQRLAALEYYDEQVKQGTRGYTKEGLDSAMEDAAAAAETYLEVGGEAARNYIAGLLEETSELEEASVLLSESGREEIVGTYGDWKDSGIELTQSVIDGIKETRPSLISEVVALVNAANTEFDKMYGSNYGGSTGLFGVAGGISMSPYVTPSAANYSNSIATATNTTTVYQTFNTPTTSAFSAYRAAAETL